MSDIIKAAARIEQNVKLNGNEFVKKRPAEYESEYRTINVKGKEYVVNAKAFVSPLAYKYVIRLDDKPVNWDMVKALDPNLRVTKGQYMIKYTPVGSPDYKKGRPFKIGQDLIRWDIRVSGTRHWHMLGEKIPELGWMQRNSTLTDEMFDIAAQHPGMAFICTVKWVEYERKLQAQSDITLETPFMSRKCSFQDYDEIYKHNDKAMLIRYLHDVLSEVQEVESSIAVQEEMRNETGETVITREQYMKGHGGVHQPKDPVTGRFIKKDSKENV